MDIMELGAIGELVGGVAVIGSLLYVGLQIRQNSTWLRANVVDGASQWMANNHLFLASQENGGLLDAMVADPTSLDTASAGRLGQVFMALTRIQETAHFHFREGHYPAEIWEGYRAHMELVTSSPFFDPWWQMRNAMFNAAFRDYVDELRSKHTKLDIVHTINPMAE